MFPIRLLFFALCVTAFVFPQALEAQTHLTIESLALNTYSRAADFTLILPSKDLDWKVAEDGRSKADVVLITESLDKRGDVIVFDRQYLTITKDAGDVAKPAVANTRFWATVKVPAKTDKIRFLLQSADKREVAAGEVARKTIYAAVPPESLALPCRVRALCQP
jgi:hypothetical protein